MMSGPGWHRSAAAIAGVATAAALSSAAYQEISAARDRRRYPPPGCLVDVGGRRLHLLAAGQGSPAVVIVPAMCDGVLTWTRVQQALAAGTLACVYDRSGIGWSDPPPRGGRTPAALADELHALLAAAPVPVPAVVVGHSLGGVIARQLAVRHPGDVEGLVLVDSSHEDQASRRGVEGWEYGRAVYARWMLRRQLRPLGLRRLAADLGLDRELDAELAREVEPRHAAAARAETLSTRRRRVFVRESLMMARLSGGPPSLGSLPLTVITAGEPLPGWLPMQAELAGLSDRSRQVTAEGSGHYVHLDDPDLVADVIRDMIRAASG
ncbi:MAG TPA: alpha/beta hydrolase [Streptosporangiaceae bacterium]|nr:alpha/beta hydrolase [Streptosporangiaceae bacterium]